MYNLYSALIFDFHKHNTVDLDANRICEDDEHSIPKMNVDKRKDVSRIGRSRIFVTAWGGVIRLY